jgi:hypothetical protein
MAFLDNSGDIILDAVLTDLGRYRLARGDGSFKVKLFALGDDEINYALYDKNNASGSAYYDLEILQTPVLEAFTNNAASMNSKLISNPRTNLLYLPILKLNGEGKGHQQSPLGGFVVAVDSNSQEATSTGGLGNGPGIIYGESLKGGYIRIDQGLDTNEVSSNYLIASDLNEVQYQIDIDNRLGSIVSSFSGDNSNVISAEKSFIDDDNIATYFLSLNDNRFVTDNSSRDSTTLDPNQVIKGPRGTSIHFGVQSSIDLNTSDYLFDTLGGTWYSTDTGNDSGQNAKYIDTIVRVTGLTTGYRIDVPVRFAKVPT